ncbi:hypothetical protein AciX8_2997 [Granulicella mallensis MP5ACTX8]|uniref:Uncharacterized protein n=1 Tax=Granulicella mallensis (strain ATCC BAA-1857 / DSM 23137 / MP5ACTX8) TaxID=682795 RepID=G8NRE2_GRAMM|nr:hypothetical protein AciX8_2997 [Granulicella mallensis MP5ACTX8]
MTRCRNFVTSIHNILPFTSRSNSAPPCKQRHYIRRHSIILSIMEIAPCLMIDYTVLMCGIIHSHIERLINERMCLPHVRVGDAAMNISIRVCTIVKPFPVGIST